VRGWTLRRILTTIAAVVAGPTYAEVGPKELEKAIFAAVPREVELPNSVQRLAFAQAIERYWEDFDSRIPRLSPKEEEWVRAELEKGGDRLMHLYSSKEYAIWNLNDHTDLCLNNVRQVIQAFVSPDGMQTEMFYWLKMIICYDGGSDLEINLENAGIPFNDDAGMYPQLPVSTYVQRIIVNKVGPAAMAETMGWSYDSVTEP
jgi:hypothetical protein